MTGKVPQQVRDALAEYIDREHCMCGCSDAEAIAASAVEAFDFYLAFYCDALIDGRSVPVYRFTQGEEQ